MLRYILGRLTGLIGVLFAVSLLTFFLMHSIPGGPYDMAALQHAQMIPQDLLDRINHLNGLDKPVWEQYLIFLRNALRFDFGYSYISSGRTITQIFAQHWPYSAQVGAMTFVFAFPIGLVLGIVSAMKRGTWIDRYITGNMLVVQALPSFIVALVLKLVFAVQLHWFPTQGWGPPNTWVLPVLANSLGPILTLQRYTRGAVADVMEADYVRTARAKGLTERRVTLVHIFKNALTPVVTVGGPMVGSLVTGSFFVESVFRIPGLSWYLGGAIGNRDYPMIMASTMFFTAVTTIVYLVTDLLYAAIDPRVTYVKAR
jgi:ABC-type dipeptide/oligopeptide/nickel transport system permease component